MRTTCSVCNAPMTCDPEGQCWCAEFPHLMPLPNADAGCLCRDCLARRLNDGTRAR